MQKLTSTKVPAQYNRYSNRPVQGEMAVHTLDYLGVNMPLLLRVLGLRRLSHEDNSRWFWPFLRAATGKCPKRTLEVVDRYGNIFILIDDGTRASDVAFTCHLDTVAWERDPEQHLADIMLSPDGTLYLQDDTRASCLGADDGAGVYILLEMIQAGVPGRYCFFQDEEVGCIGSKYSAGDVSGFWTGVEWMISFDRRGEGVVNSQMMRQCCSDEFALELCERLGRPASAVQAGIYTDSASFMQIIPECTNIGVGYMQEHSKYETLDLNILSRLLERAVQPETWAGLPVQRDLILSF